MTPIGLAHHVSGRRRRSAVALLTANLASRAGDTDRNPAGTGKMYTRSFFTLAWLGHLPGRS